MLEMDGASLGTSLGTTLKDGSLLGTDVGFLLGTSLGATGIRSPPPQTQQASFALLPLVTK